jgi:hypothetical protein
MNNRFISFVVGAVVLFNTAVFSQVSAQLGITAGMTSFTEKIKSSGMTITPDSKMGLVAGAVLDISLMELISIEPGILYQMRGMKMSDSYGGSTATITNSLSYIAIPVHAKVKYVTPMVKPYALVGINLGILMSAKAKYEETGLPSQEQDVKDSASTVDMGLDFGAGVEFSMPKITPFVEFVYYVGLLDLQKNPAQDVTVKSNGWEIKAGMRFKM